MAIPLLSGALCIAAILAVLGWSCRWPRPSRASRSHSGTRRSPTCSAAPVEAVEHVVPTEAAGRHVVVALHDDLDGQGAGILRGVGDDLDADRLQHRGEGGCGLTALRHVRCEERIWPSQPSAFASSTSFFASSGLYSGPSSSGFHGKSSGNSDECGSPSPSQRRWLNTSGLVASTIARRTRGSRSARRARSPCHRPYRCMPARANRLGRGLAHVHHHHATGG